MKFLFLLFTLSSAFTPLHTQSRLLSSSSSISKQLLSAVDEVCVGNVAALCNEVNAALEQPDMECDVAEFEALQNTLAHQRSILKANVERLGRLLARLDGVEVEHEEDNILFVQSRPLSKIYSSMQLTGVQDEICVGQVAELCTKAAAALEQSGECVVTEFVALKRKMTYQRSVLQAHVERLDPLLARFDGVEVDIEATATF
jgi:uncharacterized protein YuzB (UPF0349 family)